MFVFPDPGPPIMNILHGWSGTCGQFGLSLFMFSFIKSSKFINLVVLVYFYISFLAFYILNFCLFRVWMSVESIDCILLSLNAILLTSSVNTFFLLLNLCWEERFDNWNYELHRPLTISM